MIISGRKEKLIEAKENVRNTVDYKITIGNFELQMDNSTNLAEKHDYINCKSLREESHLLIYQQPHVGALLSQDSVFQTVNWGITLILLEVIPFSCHPSGPTRTMPLSMECSPASIPLQQINIWNTVVYYKDFQVQQTEKFLHNTNTRKIWYNERILT